MLCIIVRIMFLFSMAACVENEVAA